jgi:hypothetical protein
MATFDDKLVNGKILSGLAKKVIASDKKVLSDSKEAVYASVLSKFVGSNTEEDKFGKASEVFTENLKQLAKDLKLSEDANLLEVIKKAAEKPEVKAEGLEFKLAETFKFDPATHSTLTYKQLFGDKILDSDPKKDEQVSGLPTKKATYLVFLFLNKKDGSYSTTWTEMETEAPAPALMTESEVDDMWNALNA